MSTDAAGPADRAGIISAANAEGELAREGEPKRPPSVLFAQASALRATFHGASLVVQLARQGIDGGTIDAGTAGPVLVLVLASIQAQLEAGVVQCDSFLTMAEAMSAMLPGARPAPPSNPSAPKVFGGGAKS